MGRIRTLSLLLLLAVAGASAIPACGRSGVLAGPDDDSGDDDDDGEFGNGQDGDVILAGGPVNVCVPVSLATSNTITLAAGTIAFQEQSSETDVP